MTGVASPWPKSWALRVLAFLWSAPWGIVGFLAAACLGEVSDETAGAIEFRPWAFLRRRFVARGWGAVTLGSSILYWVDSPDDGMRRHERRHVRQGLVLGPLFPIVYLVLLAIYGYERHPLEVDATKAE